MAGAPLQSRESSPMPYTDRDLDDLREYRPSVHEPDDFDLFWAGTLRSTRAAAVPLRLDFIDSPITELEIIDATFSGFDGEPVRAWIVRPRDTVPRAAIVEFQGYGGGRGLPGDHLKWAAAGFVHVIMDTRGQGSVWGTGGATPDPHGSGPATPGYMTRGIAHPDTYYFRRVYADAVRLIDDVASLEGVVSSQIVLAGASQGGGIALAAAALSDIPVGVMPDVPFLCDFRNSVGRTPLEPFTEIARYLSVHRDAVDRTFRTLSYFDGVNFARRARIPALFSVGLMDDTVLPSSIFAAYNAYKSPDRDIEVYEFNGHEGGMTAHWLRQVDWVRQRFVGA